jgi:dihydrofolate reductase
MSRVRYNVVVSLDGYITGPNGDYDWIPDDPSVDFVALFDEFDQFIMGRNTYETLIGQGSQNPLI